MEKKEEDSVQLFAPYAEYINRFVPSEELCAYLKQDRRSVGDIVDIIYFSPAASLHEKKDAINGVLKTLDCAQKDLQIKCRECILYMDMAMEVLEKNRIFSLEQWNFDEEAKQQESSFAGLYATYTDVLEEMAHWEEDDTGYWFELTAWDKDSEGKLKELVTYIIVNEKPIYCNLQDLAMERMDGFNKESAWQFHMLDMVHLNIPIPFKAGDIVEVGSAPFVPRQTILITDIGDNYDCCCIQGMGKNDSGKYEVGAVKHGMVGIGWGCKNCFLLPSFLYEMKKYDGPLRDVDDILKEVSWIIQEK